MVYYETLKRELNRRLTYGCRCDERLKDKGEGSTRLTYTGLCGIKDVIVHILTVVVYYESMKRKLKTKAIYECRCNERLQNKRFTRLTLEHLIIKTRLTNEKFASVKGECEI
jgi:hypothetical protein